MTAQDTLFTRSVSTYYSQWEFFRKLNFIEEFTNKFLQEKRRVTMVISRDDIFLYGSFTGLVGRLLHRLDPDTFEIPLGTNYYIHRHYWDHPYLLKIIQKIGALAVLPGTQLSIENFELAMNEDLIGRGRELQIEKVEDVSILEIKKRLYLHLTKTDNEIDQLITLHLELERITVDPLELAKFISSIDKR